MSVYKEMGYLVRKIKNQSTIIYNDAADYGVPIYSFSDPIMEETKGICKDLYGLEAVTERYDTGFTQTFKFDGGYPAAVEAGFEKAEIAYVSAKSKKFPGMIGYLSVCASHTISRYDY